MADLASGPQSKHPGFCRRWGVELCFGSDNALLTKPVLSFHGSLLYFFSVLQHITTLCLTWKYQNRRLSWGASSCLHDWQDPFGSIGKGQPRVFVLYQKASFIGMPNLLAFLSHSGRIVLNYTLNRRRPDSDLLAVRLTCVYFEWCHTQPVGCRRDTSISNLPGSSDNPASTSEQTDNSGPFSLPLPPTHL